MRQTDSVRIQFPRFLQPLHLVVVAVLCLLMALVTGIGTGLREVVYTVGEAGVEAWETARSGRIVAAVFTLLGGLCQSVFSAPAPLFSNIVVGVGAAVELLRNAVNDGDQQFELQIGGGNNMAFSSRCGELFTRAEVVKVGERSRYPVIESVQFVSCSFLFDDEPDPSADMDIFEDATPATRPVPMSADLSARLGLAQRTATPEAPVPGSANVAEGLRLFAAAY